MSRWPMVRLSSVMARRGTSNDRKKSVAEELGLSLIRIKAFDDFAFTNAVQIFVRVNSLGAKLRSSDLALAQITAKWKHSLQTFLDFREQCSKQGFELELGLHLKNLMVFATGQSRFKTVGSLTLDELQKAWKASGEGMNFALNFLKSNVGIDSPALLASPFLIIVLAYFGHIRGYVISSEEAAQLRYWTLVANAKGRFSRGSSETILDQDLSTLKKGGGVPDLIDRLRLQVGRLDITPDELEGNYKAFLEARRKSIATKLNDFLTLQQI